MQACALAAFFGVPLGGSLFALEINNRMGFEYYEHALESVLSGTTCLIVFRGLTGLPIGPIWSISSTTLGPSTSGIVAVGALIGLMGAGIASLFAHFHWRVMELFEWATLLTKPIARAVTASIVICGLGVVFPQSMFWGEFEFQAISTLAPNSELTHIWPQSGLLDFQPDGFLSSLALGIAKLVAVSFTVAGGYRGGFIFPFFAAGAALGRAMTFLFPSCPPQIACLCIAAGINVAITRTALATSLILATLAGEINAGPPILAASLVSLFATAYMVRLTCEILSDSA
jgi:H+/Cl- antiporter ClcA